MDFIFALFPWFITWRLNLKRAEKIALCVTLSLGIFVAIITAVRTWWKDTPLMHVHDKWYMWRDAMSEIWSVVSGFDFFPLPETTSPHLWVQPWRDPMMGYCLSYALPNILHINILRKGNGTMC